MSDEPTITPTTNGPYMVAAGLPVTDARGERSVAETPVFLCRCGGSASKPFCDGTHARIGFEGALGADHGPMSERRDAYEGDGITIYDDRTRCAHAGACTDGLAAVWKLRQEPWIEPMGAPAERIAEVVRRCPSGALTYALPGDPTPLEEQLEAEVIAVPNGPFQVRGAVSVVAPDGEAFEARNRQTLCRCGQSASKPFCDGGHWSASFRDPTPEV